MSYAYYQPNPAGKSVGDCTVRALSKALGQTWEETYVGLCLQGFLDGDMPSSDKVWGNVLKNSGFRKWIVPCDYNGNYTANDFCADNPNGVFVLAFGGHVATVVNSVLMDSWDSSFESPIYVWGESKPNFS